jgi:hypothetical protein
VLPDGRRQHLRHVREDELLLQLDRVRGGSVVPVLAGLLHEPLHVLHDLRQLEHVRLVRGLHAPRLRELMPVVRPRGSRALNPGGAVARSTSRSAPTAALLALVTAGILQSGHPKGALAP